MKKIIASLLSAAVLATSCGKEDSGSEVNANSAVPVVEQESVSEDSQAAVPIFAIVVFGVSAWAAICALQAIFRGHCNDDPIAMGKNQKRFAIKKGKEKEALERLAEMGYMAKKVDHTPDWVPGNIEVYTTYELTPNRNIALKR